MPKKVQRLLKLLQMVSLLLLLGFLYLRLTAEPRTCPRTEKIFLGEKYDVERCSRPGGDWDYFSRMRIYSKNGELLATRWFSFDRNYDTDKVKFENDKIIYNDAIREQGGGVPTVETKTLQFPLTRKDWFDANLDRILFSP